MTEAELRARDVLYQKERDKIESELCFHETRVHSPQWSVSLCAEGERYIATVTERWAFKGGGFRVLFADGKQIECANRVEVTDKLVDYVLKEGPRKDTPP